MQFFHQRTTFANCKNPGSTSSEDLEPDASTDEDAESESLEEDPVEEALLVLLLSPWKQVSLPAAQVEEPAATPVPGKAQDGCLA